MQLDDTLISDAEHRGYVSFNDERTRITYLCGRTHTEDYTDPEEPVRARVYSWLIIQKGYPAHRIELEYLVPRRTPGDYADIVVFRDDARTEPFLVVETKRANCSTAEWIQAIEQGFGNANSLRSPEYLLIDRGNDSILFDIQNYPPTERQANTLGDRNALADNYGIARQFRLVAGTDQDVQAFGPRDLETKVRRAHASIWAGGKRDPLTAFDEWSKILFAKIWDERHTPNGEPRQLQISPTETVAQAASRIRSRFSEATRSDRTIFTDPRINLPDEKIAEVVKIIQDVGFTLCEVDTLGSAFEHFFSSIFRGELGQYFTRREIARFICAALFLTDSDFVLDPTAGSGGFLLEALFQVWHFISERYSGQAGIERRKIDFALQHLYGIEINEVLSRVCKTNLLIHKDGHTNIEGERSCLDTSFSNRNINPSAAFFNVVLGNPPFGDEVKEGDSDRLGDGALSDFDISRGYSRISSELIIIERSLQFLKPGGRLGMVVPDGALNNSGESSRCPAFRRYVLRHAKIEMIVSLPDYAFRKAGAQNKTSLLFLQKYTGDEKERFNRAFEQYVEQEGLDTEQLSISDEQAAIHYALQEQSYPVFLAEVEHIGYTPSGTYSPQNQLYSLHHNYPDYDNKATVLGQYNLFRRNRHTYRPIRNPSCHSISITEIIDAHPSFRLDPKFHLFQLERIRAVPPGMQEYRLGNLLTRRKEEIDPTTYPDEEFLTLTLSQDGSLSPREAGKGNNPPSWYGAYFTSGSRWYRARTGDLIISQIDLWKGCVAVIPSEYDGAIVTQEFPLYQVDTAFLDPKYLALLLRSHYFQRAIRAITTGHSNRRRTQSDDFEDLVVFLPEPDIQEAIAAVVEQRRIEIDDVTKAYIEILEVVERILLGEVDPFELLEP